MAISSDARERKAFFDDVEAASKKAIWCALATVDGDVPRVRIVHPTWEGETLWFATGASSAKIRQLRANPNVDIQFQVGPPDFVHVMVRGKAEVETLYELRNPGWVGFLFLSLVGSLAFSVPVSVLLWSRKQDEGVEQ